jgi:zinc transporter ZupT
VARDDFENRSYSHLLIVTWIAIPLAGVTVLSTFAGGLLALRLHREVATLIALTGGIVVAVALFDVLPEALRLLDDPRDALAVVGVGFLLFFVGERLLEAHSHPSWKRTALTVFGFAATFAVARAAT